MNEQNAENPLAGATREQIMAALFANMIMQQTNMAMMFLGKMPHPETGEHIKDIEMAQIFIDQLEMLEVKTKGNLDKREEHLLKQSLTSVRMAFVEAAREQGPESAPEAKPAATSPAADAPKSEAASEPSPGPSETDSHKKFSKKY